MALFNKIKLKWCIFWLKRKFTVSLESSWCWKSHVKELLRNPICKIDAFYTLHCSPCCFAVKVLISRIWRSHGMSIMDFHYGFPLSARCCQKIWVLPTSFPTAGNKELFVAPLHTDDVWIEGFDLEIKGIKRLLAPSHNFGKILENITQVPHPVSSKNFKKNVRFRSLRGRL